MRKIVLAFDSFKGSAGSFEIAKTAEKAIQEELPECQIIRFPIADGGERTTEALCTALNAQTVSCRVHDPFMKPIDVSYGIVNKGVMAIIKMASACGPPLIADALKRGYREFIIRIGGSATNDAGIGMKRKSVCMCLVMFLMSLALQAKDKDVAVAEALVKRLLPSYTESFQFQKLKGEKDCFTIESAKDKIVIGGNNANSMAMGLNHYLKYYCLTTVSWYADIAVEIPEELPVVSEKVVSEARVDTRFFLNYCTYGYTMPWWQWKEWERFIDWMALNGINMPLAITGQEAVWYKVWSKMGMSDIEIRSYFTGPPYLPWHRMANIDRWNGPLPMEWLEHQVSLQKKILARERELNMKPVLPAFSGHVPADLKRIYPEADIQHLGKWAGFTNTYRCNFLNPNDPLFAKIQKLFLDEQEKLFGTDHIYGLDPFNEVDPPSFEPEYLRKMASDMYATLTAADPKAQWMQMTWMFYFDRDKWTSGRIKALLTGVPQNKMTLLDYHCENVELWRRTEHFHGQPYIWCYLGNFGGNTTLTGNVKESGARLENALINGGDNLKGIGSTLEGLDVMQFPYEYILEKAWNLNVDDNKWIECLADRHVGCVSQPVRDAWKILFNDIYVQVPRTLGTLPGYRPVLNKNSEKRTSNMYSNVELLEVWKKLNEAPSDRRDAFRLDLITVGRQVIGNYFLDVKMEFDRMVEAKDYQALKVCGEKMKEILNDLDKLNAFHPYCSLDKWIDDARKMGDSPQLKDYYEKNARNLITTWGGSLNDYASRSWAGLISDYYAKRWEMYIDTFIKAVGKGVEVEQKQLEDELKEIEEGWVNATEWKGIRKDVHSTNDELLSFSTFLFSKYQRVMK